MENALKAKPEDVRAQYERLLKDLKEAYGEAMLELRARKYCSPSPEAQHIEVRLAIPSAPPPPVHASSVAARPCAVSNATRSPRCPVASDCPT